MPLTVPTFTPCPNVGSQIERAIAAWFVACGIGDVTSNHFSNDNTDRKAPLNDILAHSSVEKVENSRIEAYQVRIQSKFDAIVQPGQSDTAWNWKQINEWTGNVMSAMSLRNSGDRDFKATADFITAAGRDLAVDNSAGADPIQAKRALDNADMVDFTCQKVIYRGAKRIGADAGGALVFVEIRNFEIHAVPFNVD